MGLALDALRRRGRLVARDTKMKPAVSKAQALPAQAKPSGFWQTTRTAINQAIRALGGPSAAARAAPIAGGIAAAVTPTMANDPRYSDNPRMYADFHRSIERIDVKVDGTAAEVRIGKGSSRYAPMVLPKLAGAAGSRDQLPDVYPPPPMALPDVRPWAPSNPWDDEYGSAYDDVYVPGMKGIPASAEDKARNLIDRGLVWPDLPELSLPDLPPGLIAKPTQPGATKVISVSLQDGRILWRSVNRQVSATPFKAWRDSKYGRKLVTQMYGFVTATYGVATEVQDAAEVMAWSMYGKDDRGRIVPAMQLEARNMLAVYQGYLEGDYRLDTVGFVEDYTHMQVSDNLYAATGQVQLEVARRLGGRFGWAANTAVNQIANAERDRAIKERRAMYAAGEYQRAEDRRFHDVRSDWIRGETSQLRKASDDGLSALGLARADRVRSLWR